MQVQNIKKLFIKQWLWFFCLIVFTSFYLMTYTGVTLSASYLSFFYFKQTLNEFITNCYYLIGCVIYQMYLFISTLLVSNQQISTNTPVQSLKHEKSIVSLPVNTLSSNNTNANENLFFLQKTLSSLNNLNFSESTLLTQSNTSTNLTINTSFINKVNFLSSNMDSVPNKTLGLNSNKESSYTLSTKLNPDFSNSLTLSTTLENLYTNEDSFQNDPMLTEGLTHNLNNIAKQQR
tara:strand:- start:709 stop:1410 length:702 start_codon:yes stop_codon:yes gene_type:complete